MFKTKKLFLKYRKDTNDYYVLKVVNVDGFNPEDILTAEDVKKLYLTEIEVVLK